MSGTDGTDDMARGNTKSRAKRYRSWFFTYNNPCELAQMFDILDESGVEKYIFQLEEGENETPHYQGVIWYKNPQGFNAMKNLCREIHWEPCKNLIQAIKYCCKIETRINGPWAKNIDIPLDIKLITPRDWQVDLENELLNDPDDRKIIWYSDPVGGSGKTSLAKYLAVKYKALVVSGKASDVKYAVNNLVSKGRPPRIIIYVCPRTYENFVSYDALESVKDGLFFSSKYESGMCMYPNPHVIVFANFVPNLASMTADRWDLRHLSSDPNADIINCIDNNVNTKKASFDW